MIFSCKVRGFPLGEELRARIIQICNRKIESKSDSVGVSSYAFYANVSDTPPLLMEVANWWIQTHELDHFVKAKLIRDMGKKVCKNN